MNEANSVLILSPDAQHRDVVRISVEKGSRGWASELFLVYFEQFGAFATMAAAPDFDPGDWPEDY